MYEPAFRLISVKFGPPPRYFAAIERLAPPVVNDD